MTSGEILIQFALSDVVCCAKGSAEQTNRSLFITHVDKATNPTLPPQDSCNEPVFDSENPPVTTSASADGDASKSSYRMHIVRCRTTYEVSFSCAKYFFSVLLDASNVFHRISFYWLFILSLVYY